MACSARHTLGHHSGARPAEARVTARRAVFHACGGRTHSSVESGPRSDARLYPIRGRCSPDSDTRPPKSRKFGRARANLGRLRSNSANLLAELHRHRSRLAELAQTRPGFAWLLPNLAGLHRRVRPRLHDIDQLLPKSTEFGTSSTALVGFRPTLVQVEPLLPWPPE